MATEKEEIILDIQIDQGQAEKDLVKIEKALMANKKAVADLNKAYKEGTITQDEYIEENIRLQAVQKKEQEQKRNLVRLIETESNSRNALKLRVSQLTKEYDNLNRKTAEGARRAEELEKELSDLNAQISKTSKSAGLFKDQIGNYPEVFAEATQNINVYGMSLGDVASKMKGFLNPATAIIGVIGLLGAAYTSSAAGAEAYLKTQERVQAGLDVVNNRVGNSEGGNWFSRQVDKLNPGIAIANLTNLTREGADAEKQLIRIAEIELGYQRELEKQLLIQQGLNKTRERDAENFRRIRDDSERSYEERLQASAKVQELMQGIEDETLTILRKKVASIINYATVTGQVANGEIKNRDLNLQVIDLKNEIADKQEEVNGKLTENVAAEAAIRKEIEDQAEARRKAREELQKAIKYTPPPSTGPRQLTDEEIIAQASRTQTKQAASTEPPLGYLSEEALDKEEQLYMKSLELSDEYFAQQVKKNESYKEYRAQTEQELIDMQIKNREAEFNAAVQLSAQFASLFEESTTGYKILASAQTLISTYLSAQKAFESLVGVGPAGPVLGALAAAAATAEGLARVAEINGVGFAEGGYTGPGRKYDVAGVVHRDEYVTPSNIVHRKEAQPHLQALERMRLRGYADGGLVTSASVSSTDQAVIAANALKDMPAPEVSVVEINKGQKRVQVKETISRQ